MTLIRGLFSGLFPLMVLTLLASCQKENPIVSKEPQVAARYAVGNYEKKPASVRKPTATNITDRSARIEWQKASRAEEYIVLRRALYADNTESSLHSVHRTSALSYDDTSLAPQTEYIYRIVARNNVGEAQRSPHLKFGTLSEPKVEVVAPEEEEVAEEVVPEEEEDEEEPSKGDAETESAEEVGEYESKPVQVSKPSATIITDRSARIEWKKSRRAQEYIVTRRALYADNPESSLSPIATTSALSYDDTGLAPQTEYIYRIVARNNVGEAQRSSHLKFRTLVEPEAEVIAPGGGVSEEFTPEEEEEPPVADAATVESNMRVFNFRATPGSRRVKTWLPARNARTVRNTDCGPWIDMSWTPPIDTDPSTLTKHQYQIADSALYATLANPTVAPWSEVDHVDIPDSGPGGANFGTYRATSYQGGCLERGATYYLTIRGVFGDDPGTSAGPINVTTFALPEAPELTATPGEGQIVLNWTEPDDGGESIWGYRIMTNTGGLGPDGMGAPWEVLAQLPATTTSYTHTELTPGVTRYYWVQAASRIGIGPFSEPASATPRIPCETPGKVANLHVTNVRTSNGDYVVRLNWDEGQGADIYGVYRIDTSNPDPDGDGVARPVELAKVTFADSYEDGNINSNTTYTYRVYAGNTCLDEDTDEDEEVNLNVDLYNTWPMSARSRTVHITTPDFQGSAFSPPTPGCPEDRSNDGDRDNDYPRNISTCGVIPTNGDDIEGTLESRSDHDWYRVDLEEGRWQVYAYMEAADGRRVVLSGLYDHRGRKLPGWRNFSQNTGLYLNDTAAEFTVKRGTYFIDVHSAGFNSGRYSLSVSEQED